MLANADYYTLVELESLRGVKDVIGDKPTLLHWISENSLGKLPFYILFRKASLTVLQDEKELVVNLEVDEIFKYRCDKEKIPSMVKRGWIRTSPVDIRQANSFMADEHLIYLETGEIELDRSEHRHKKYKYLGVTRKIADQSYISAPLIGFSSIFVKTKDLNNYLIEKKKEIINYEKSSGLSLKNEGLRDFIKTSESFKLLDLSRRAACFKIFDTVQAITPDYDFSKITADDLNKKDITDTRKLYELVKDLLGLHNLDTFKRNYLANLLSIIRDSADHYYMLK